MASITLYHDNGGCQVNADSFQLPLDPVERRNYAWVHSKATADSSGSYHIVGQKWDPPGWGYRIYIYRGFMKFSGSIPASAIISSAKLRLYGRASGPIDTGFTLVIVDATGLPPYSMNTYGELLPQVTAFASISTGVWNDVDWNELVFNSAGLAYLDSHRTNPQFGARSNLDISSTPPTIDGAWDRQSIRFYGGIWAGATEKAELIVTYTILPTVTTNAATNLWMTGARLNGTLNDDGGEICLCNFEWGETIAYGNVTASQVTAVGPFSTEISGLSPGTLYHFKAKAVSSSGAAYGADQTFTTLQEDDYGIEDGDGGSDIAGHPWGNCGVFDFVSNPSVGQCCGFNILDFGVRFYNVTIPQGAAITAAYLKLYVKFEGCPLGGTLVNSKIKGEAADNPVTFTTEANYNARPKTTADRDWDNDFVGTLNTWVNTIGITNIVQEIINRPGWSSGNYMTIFVEDDGSLPGFLVDFSRAGGYEPILHIEYAVVPLITTDPATLIEETTATLNADITAIGADAPDERGFDWGIAIVTENSWTETGSFPIGVFSHAIDSLLPGTKYLFRGKAHNSQGWGYG